jgi:hypothetical protein
LGAEITSGFGLAAKYKLVNAMTYPMAKWISEGDKQTAREEQAKRKQHETEQQQSQAATEQTVNWENWITAKIEARAALIMDSVGEVLGEISARALKDLETKCAELRCDLERERSNYQRNIERERTAHQRMQDLLMKQLESMQQAQQRESVGQQRQYLALKQYIENTFDELFSSSHDNVWDAIEAFRDGYRKRATAAQIRQIRQIA